MSNARVADVRPRTTIRNYLSASLIAGIAGLILNPAESFACACGCGVFDVGTSSMLSSRQSRGYVQLVRQR